jgi:hypothetical protein
MRLSMHRFKMDLSSVAILRRSEKWGLVKVRLLLFSWFRITFNLHILEKLMPRQSRSWVPILGC